MYMYVCIGIYGERESLLWAPRQKDQVTYKWKDIRPFGFYAKKQME